MCVRHALYMKGDPRGSYSTMQNKNETNDKVSQVVADFFKSNPIAKHGSGGKRRPYPDRNPKRSSSEHGGEKKYDARSHEKDAFRNKQRENASEQIKPAAAAQPTTEQSETTREPNEKKRYVNDRSKSRERRDRLYDRHMRSSEQAQLEQASTENTASEIAQAVEGRENACDDTRADARTFERPARRQTQNVEMTESTESSESEWYDPNTPVEIIGVRFKSEGKVYYFAPMGIQASKNDKVIVETARGLEFGTVHTPNSTVKIKDVVMPLKNVVRLATEDDIKHYEENNEKVAEAMRICNERIAVHGLDMKLVEVEYTFDNTKLLFYFTSEGRVDFRELVKDLAGIFKTRIELRQIGIREETKLLGGLGICGRPFCCKTFLNDFVQVSIKMAKEQGLSLNSAKISGACGRLMCCLRYEYDTYEEEIRRTPKVDTPVITPDGPGVICETQPLAGLCKVRLTKSDDGEVKVYHRDDLKAATHKPQKDAKEQSGSNDSNDVKEENGASDAQEARDANDPRESRGSRDAKAQRDSGNGKTSRPQRDPKPRNTDAQVESTEKQSSQSAPEGEN